MKIRSAFVSNSSSSSFVFLGINLADHPELEKKYFDRANYTILNEDKLPRGTEIMDGDGDTVIGLNVAKWTDQDGDVAETDFSELTDYAKKLEAVIGIKPTLYTGTTY